MVEYKKSYIISGAAMITQKFLEDNIDAHAKIESLSMKKLLSPAMNSRYGFWQLNLLDKTYLLASPSNQYTIKSLARDFEEIELKTSQQVILYTDTLSPYSKRRLIAERIPFLLFDKQFFLPMLALNIRAGSEAALTQRDILTPAAQVVFLCLLYAEAQTTAQQELQERLGLSAISISRAVKELQTFGLVSVHTGGKTNRKREISVLEQMEFYRRGIKYFGRAVKQTIYCEGEPDKNLLLSGLSALSRRTMINPPKQEYYALYSRARNSINLSQISKAEYLDYQDAFCIDLLSYDPAHLALDGMVDPVTMILTLHERDERIDAELNNYMKGFAWYTD